MKSSIVVLALLVAIAKSNIWDNIFSKTRSIPRVRLDTDFKTEFVILRNQQQFFVMLDYNVGNRRATINIDTEVGLFFFKTRMRVALLQANFKTLKAVLATPLNCNNYYIDSPVPSSSDKQLPNQQLIVYYLNYLLEFSHSGQDHYFFLLNPDLLGRFDRNDVPSMGVWVDQQGAIVQVIISHAPVSFIAESTYPQLSCSSQPEKLDGGMLERVFEEVKKYI